MNPTEKTPTITLHRCDDCASLVQMHATYAKIPLSAFCDRCGVFREFRPAMTVIDRKTDGGDTVRFRDDMPSDPCPIREAEAKQDIDDLNAGRPIFANRRRYRHFIACLLYPLRWIPRAWADWRRGYTLAERDSMLRKLAEAAKKAAAYNPGDCVPVGYLTAGEARALSDHLELVRPQKPVDASPSGE